MPEGHTLHRLAGALDDAFAGRTLSASSPQGRFSESARLLDGVPLAHAEAWGKHLFTHHGGDAHAPGEQVVHVHLGLYGSFDISHGPAGGAPEPPRGQVRLRLVADDERGTTWADLRGPTACELVTPSERERLVERIGPDPLRDDADPAPAFARISRSRAPLAVLLMDQAVLAGIGNVYRAEILFRHRLDPFREGRTLRRGRFAALWEDLATLMRHGVATGRIDTVRPEHVDAARAAPGARRRRGGDVYVYRRDGEACLVCGTKVRTAEVAARNLFWCPRCQPRFRSRAVQ